MSNSPQIARSILGQLLKKYRLRAKLTVSEASRETGISEPKLRKLERGANDAVRLPDIYACGSVYTCESLEINHLKDLALGAHQPGWYHEYDVPAEFAHFIELEGNASEIYIHETEIIHGLFQTPEYIDALRQNVPNPNDAVETGLRIARQAKLFDQPNPPGITYITSESALRRLVGDSKVMKNQVQHLAKKGERPNISISVVTFETGAYPAIAGPFTLFKFEDTFPSTLYMEAAHGSRYEEGKYVDLYTDILQRTLKVTTPIEEFINVSNIMA